MKKIFTIVLLIVIVIIGVLAIPFDENINKKYKINDGKLTINVPNLYEKLEEENNRINLYNAESGVSIKCGTLEENFWSSEDLNERIDEYIKVISSANYDAEIKNVKTEILEQNNNLARIQVDLIKQTSDRKTITILTANIEPNMIIEITGTKDAMEKNIEEIEEIISGIKIKK